VRSLAHGPHVVVRVVVVVVASFVGCGAFVKVLVLVTTEQGFVERAPCASLKSGGVSRRRGRGVR
jgi:hypothetical protein